MKQDWEPIIGLEIHAQLNTASKLFSSDFNRFGDEPNTNISDVSVAIPGSLPVVNKGAVQKAIRFGLAIKGKIRRESRFDRKSYFYPDCPRNFQITQFDYPIVTGGEVVAIVNGKEKSFGITRVQLEDDAGMLKHFSTFAGVDFNRAGVPLIEIVSEPCMRSAADAVAYATTIRSILDHLDICDCNMEEGSLRFDVNVSVRKLGEEHFRNRIEIKNMNSFSNLEKAIKHEIERQISLYESASNVDPSKVVEQCTYRWDPESGATVLMRTKEDAEDYRYFPEPDLPPLVLSETDIEAEMRTLPELPLEKERRFVRDYALSAQQSYVLTMDRRLAIFFEEAVREYPSSPKAIANWICVEFGGRLKEQGIVHSGITPAHLAELVRMIDSGALTGKTAKVVADEMVTHPQKGPRAIVTENPSLAPMSDMAELERIVAEVLLEHEQSVRDFLKGRDRAFAFLVGQVMKRTKGSAPPDLANRLLREGISRLEGSL